MSAEQTKGGRLRLEEPSRSETHDAPSRLEYKKQLNGYETPHPPLTRSPFSLKEKAENGSRMAVAKFAMLKRAIRESPLRCRPSGSTGSG